MAGSTKGGSSSCHASSREEAELALVACSSQKAASAYGIPYHTIYTIYTMPTYIQGKKEKEPETLSVTMHTFLPPPGGGLVQRTQGLVVDLSENEKGKFKQFETVEKQDK